MPGEISAGRGAAGQRNVQPKLVPAAHGGEELLLDFAVGSCSEAESLIVASHVALCPLCRDHVVDVESVGGSMLESIEPCAVTDSCLQSTLDRIERDRIEKASHSTPSADIVSRVSAECADRRVPAPLRPYLRGDLGALPWKRLARGVGGITLPTAGRARALLMRMDPGAAAPQHTHEGRELTLVLSGGFTDMEGHFLPGDLVVGDDTIDHRPIADGPDECICLVVLEGRVRLTGPVGRWLNPFVQI